jgi:co-chaperonin GroES (HSP10)
MIKALLDKVVIHEMKVETTKGGLIIPDSVQQPQAFGKVVSIGEKVEAPVQIGDVLIFHTSGGMAMVVDGKVLRCLMEAEIYGIVQDEGILGQLSLIEVKQKDLDTLDEAMKTAQTQAAGGGKSNIIRV